MPHIIANILESLVALIHIAFRSYPSQCMNAGGSRRISDENAQKAGVDDRVQFVQQDLFQTDLSEATVVTLYLLPELNKQLRPRLLSQLKPGTRIVSHEFDMGEWKPQRVVVVQGPQQGEHVAAFPILNGAKRSRVGVGAAGAL